MGTLKDLMEEHLRIAQEMTVWMTAVNHLNEYAEVRPDKAKAQKMSDDAGRVVKPHVIDGIIEQIMDKEVEPRRKRLDVLEGSTVEVKKDGKPKASKGTKRRSAQKGKEKDEPPRSGGPEEPGQD